MKLRLAIQVHGKAVPQGSKTAYVRGGRAVVVDQAKERLEPWRDRVAGVARRNFEGTRIAGPVKVSFVIVKVRSKSHFTSRGFLSSVGAAIRQKFAPGSAPDLGKLERALEDALTGIVYDDDSLIVWRDSRKVWGTTERVLIYVWELEAGDISGLSWQLPLSPYEHEAATPLTPDEHRALEVQRAG